MNKIFNNSEGKDKRYENIRLLAYNEDEREFINEMWLKWSPYCADKDHFLIEIRNDYLARVWEMYLGCLFLENGFKLEKPPAKGPDICVISETKIWIEAISVKPGDGADKYKEPKPGWVSHFDEEKLLLRYTNAICEKIKKYDEYVETKIVGSNEPFIIAINSGEISCSDIGDARGVPAIVKSVLPFGKEYLKMQLFTGKITGHGCHYRGEVKKHSGASVNTTLFQKSESKGITGLFHSLLPLYKFNLPKRFGDDMKYFHNPIAINPLEIGCFQFGKEYWICDNELRSEDRRKK